METEITIRQFVDDDAPQVRELFIVVNRLLSPADLSDAFEVYIKRALAEEIDELQPITVSTTVVFGWRSKTIR